MSSTDEQILRTAKEIAVKFIETGRISPTNFREIFLAIYDTVESAVKREAETVVTVIQTDKTAK